MTRPFNIPEAFCPSIGTRPTIEYASVVQKALKTYTGARGDVITALSFYAKHCEMRIEGAKKYISKYLSDVADDILAEEYRESWVSRYVDYLNNEDEV